MKSRWILGLAAIILTSCNDSDDQVDYVPTPLSLEVPQIFQDLLPEPDIPSSNPQSVEGVALGKKLFFDPILSADGSLACADCHAPAAAFSDNRQFSIGIDGLPGTRNSMPLQNLAWNINDAYNWDGSATTLEEQAFEPVTNPVEMHNTWTRVAQDLSGASEYPIMFERAFGNAAIDSVQVTKAIAQFVRTLISGNSRFDRYLLGQGELTQSELNGIDIFMDEERGDCFHCHGNPNSPLWTDNTFHNNGLDEMFTDRGLGKVTGDPRDFGLFRTPSLRNLAYTAPYMHDGRFSTLDEVIDHYSEGLVYSETIDPLMKKVAQGGVQLSEDDKADLKAFLLSLSEPAFLENPDFQE